MTNSRKSLAKENYGFESILECSLGRRNPIPLYNRCPVRRNDSRRDFYWIRSRSKLQASQSKIRELEKFSKQAMDAQDSQYRIPRNSNNFRWFTHHLGGEWIENYFCAKLEHGDFVLLQYPAALSRSAASSPFRFIPGILIAIGVLGTFMGFKRD